MKTMCAVSVAIEVAPRSEIETFAFFRAIESLMPSPTKQTFRPSFWSFSTYSALSAGQHLGEIPVHPQDSASLRVGASWSPEMIAMCLIPRFRRPSMIARTSGRTAACSSMAPPSSSSTPTITSVLPSRWASSRASCDLGRDRDVLQVHEPALPTRMAWPSTWTVIP